MREPTIVRDGRTYTLHQWRMCGRKRSFETQSKANKTARKFDRPQRAYECPYCHTWHLTTAAPEDTA